MSQDKTEWDLDSLDAYKEDMFYVHSKEEDRESIPIHIRVPAAIHRRMSKIIEHKEVTFYETMADLVRDAIHHRIHYLETHHIEPDDTLRRLRIISMRSQEEKIRRDFQSTVDGVKADINYYLGRGNQNKALSTLKLVVEEIDGMKDLWWRKRYLASLASEFGDLMFQLEVKL